MLGPGTVVGCVFGSIWLVSLASSYASAQVEQPTMVLHVETREAFLDVVARDGHNMPITDLTAGEFQVYEVPEQGGKILRPVLSLITIDPQHETQENGAAKGFRVSSGAICAINSAAHYRITIAASSQPGYHSVRVQTSRPNVRLTFRRRYYVGHSRKDVTPAELQRLVTPDALREAACYHPLTPATLALTARVVDGAGGDGIRYAAGIKPEAMGRVGIDGDAPRLQLEFGMCLFDADGEVTDYLRSSLDRRLSEADVAWLRKNGFVSTLTVPGEEAPALARVAVLDRATGNLGTIDVVRPVTGGGESSRATERPRRIGDIRAFGSVTPEEGAFCGDVYELPAGTVDLSSLRELDPVASIYAGTLDVPFQDITRMGGIPGVTHSSVWFGIDYYGRFYVSRPGAYRFELESDDGSRLEIDGQLLINLDGLHMVSGGKARMRLSAGWHSIHVPYFQGKPISLALVLKIQPPGGALRPFRLADFVPSP